MSLQTLLDNSLAYEGKKQGISEQRLLQQLDNIRDKIAFFRQYPDLFIDFIQGPEGTFKFLYYQRIFLRIVMRHRYVYATFPRAYSKSFLSMMALMIRCVLYPGADLFVTTGGKEQAASITVAKIEEICRLIPALANQINWDRGKTKKSRDDVNYVFKNGSRISILAAKESSRGQRRTGGIMEECVLIDQTMLNEVIIPTTNVNRQLADGTRDSKEVVNKSQIYITTAGWKNSFAYDKLIQLLIRSLIQPDEVMIMGGTYETPILEGLLDEDFVQQLKLSGTFNEDSFDRQYRSLWSGDAQNAFFSSQVFDKHRVLRQPEGEYSGRSSRSAYYVLGVDVGRIGCTSEVMVFKCTPQPQGASIKSLVNLYTFEAQHFQQQAIHIKKIYYKYKARKIALDTNGLGIGLLDFMVLAQETDDGDYLPPFGVQNDDEGVYKKIFKGVSQYQKDAIFQIKANAPINTEAYSYTQTQMSSGKIKFLIDQAQAKAKLMQTRTGQNMTVDKRNDYLRPFVLTTILREQMLNLVEDNEGVNIILKQDSRGIKKDKFSAFVYGLYYIKQEEERSRKKKKRDLSKMCLFTPF